MVIAIVIVAALAGVVLYYHYSYGTVEVYVQGDPSFAVYITVSSVMLHSESGGWITLSNSSTTVQLTNSPPTAHIFDDPGRQLHGAEDGGIVS
jgi:hypothetical protein